MPNSLKGIQRKGFRVSYIIVTMYGYNMQCIECCGFQGGSPTLYIGAVGGDRQDCLVGRFYLARLFVGGSEGDRADQERAEARRLSGAVREIYRRLVDLPCGVGSAGDQDAEKPRSPTGVFLFAAVFSCGKIPVFRKSDKDVRNVLENFADALTRFSGSTATFPVFAACGDLGGACLAPAFAAQRCGRLM